MIPLDKIKADGRARTVYNTTDLAENIALHGLIQPIILRQDGDEYILVGGGRRLAALRELGITHVEHGVSSVPGVAGYVLQSESPELPSPLHVLLGELAENACREDFAWTDKLALIHKAWKLAKKEKSQLGERLLLQDFAVTLGVQYADLYAATILAEDVSANPGIYASCTSIRGAYQLKLKAEAKRVAQVLATRTPETVVVPAVHATADGLSVLTLTESPDTIPLSSWIWQGNGLDILANYSGPLSHIVTDPDYAIDVARLGANMDVADGVVQASPEESLLDYQRLITLAWDKLPPTGWLVFWYDLEWHSHLLDMVNAAGFRVQRWPLTWLKLGHNSNASPQYNFGKNVEFAMACRKPLAVMAKPTPCAFSIAAGGAARHYNHPFAKPSGVWAHILNAIAHEGDLIFDPFMGSASSLCAAVTRGLRIRGAELQPDHYNTALINLKTTYNTLFTCQPIYT